MRENATLAFLLGVAALIPLNYMPGVGLWMGTRLVPPTVLIFFPVGVVTLLLEIRRLIQQREAPGFLLWTVALCVSLVISAFVATSKSDAFNAAAGFVFRGGAAAFLGYAIGRDAEKRRMFVRWFPVLAAAVAVIALYEPVSGHYLIFERHLRPGQAEGELWTPTHRVAVAGIGQPLPLAAFLLSAFPVALWQGLKHKDTRALVCSALITVGLLATFRRSAYCLMLAMSVVTVMQLRGKRAAVVIGLAVVTMALAALFVAPKKLVSQRFHPSNIAQELQSGHRTHVFRVAATIFAARPWLGLGTRQYESAFGRYAVYEGAVNAPDNQFLKMIVENGVVGLLTFLGFVGFTLSRVWQGRHGPGFPFFLSAAGSVLLFFILDTLFWPAPCMALMAMAGIGCGWVKHKEPLRS